MIIPGGNMSALEKITQESFSTRVEQAQSPVLVEFGAEWCAPCKRLEPILVELGGRWKDRVQIVSMDIDECVDLTLRFQIMSVPTIILFSGGQPVQRVLGLQSRERIIEKIEPFLE
jgi:thioredoxin 1